jgi:uncharacterized caspase-like protein
MRSETTRYLELLEQRLALLGSLASALTAARADIVSLDISGLESRIVEQERLCVEIRSLDAQLDRVQRQCANYIGAAPAQAPRGSVDADTIRRRETINRLNRAQAAVKKLNDEHRALLRRSRRTVSALLNSYHSFAMTYANPGVSSASAGEAR